MNTTIPTTLIALRQWVTWRYEPDPRRPDKPKKMPKNPATGSNAQSNNAQTWGTYQQALRAAEGRNHSGVGFVFTPEDPFVGGDLDGCRNPETGEIAEWAAPWLDRLLPVAYVEVSPSGKGVKFIVRGELPKALKVAIGDHTGIELYAQRRFFTITAQALEGCASEPQLAQGVLDDLFAEFAPAPAEPEFTPEEDQPQEAVAALAGDWREIRKQAIHAITKRWVEDRVAFACEQLAGAIDGNKHNRRVEMGRLLGGIVAAAPNYLTSSEAERVLFHALPPSAHAATELKAIRDGIATGRESPLPHPTFPTDHDLLIGDHACCPNCNSRVQRSKFDYPGSTQPGWYCPRCKFPMVWPLEANTGSASAEEPRALSHDDDSVTALPLLIPASLLGQLPPAVAIVPDLLYRNRLHVLFGAPGSGKSFISLDLACILSQFAPVVYLAAEAIEDYEARVDAWKALHKLPVDNLYFWREPIRLANQDDVERFTVQAKSIKPIAVFVDPLADCMAGLVESTSEGMSVAVQGLNHIRRGTGAGVIVIHHTGWGEDRERGSSLLRGAARIVIKIEQRDDGVIAVSCVKKNQGKPFAPRSFQLIPAGEMGSVVPVPSSRVLRTRGDKPSERMMRVLEELQTQPLRNGATHTQLTKATGYPDSTMNRILTGLTENGYVVSVDKGRSSQYLLTHLGEKALEEALNWGDQDSASERGSSMFFHGIRFNWMVNTDNLPNDFQRHDAVLPSSSTPLPTDRLHFFHQPGGLYKPPVEEVAEVEGETVSEEAAIEADVARVEEHRRRRVAPTLASPDGYLPMEGY